jgi:hypothetical protein
VLEALWVPKYTNVTAYYDYPGFSEIMVAIAKSRQRHRLSANPNEMRENFVLHAKMENFPFTPSEEGTIERHRFTRRMTAYQSWVRLFVVPLLFVLIDKMFKNIFSLICSENRSGILPLTHSEGVAETSIHSFHSRLISEGLEEVSQIFLRDTHILPKLLSYEEYYRR